MHERPRLTPIQINRDLLRSVLETPLRFYVLLLFLMGLVGLGVFAATLLVTYGLGVTGLNHPVFWGFFIINFVFWVGISHAGTMISAILRLTSAEWRRPVVRAAEVMTVFSLLTAALFVVLHTGRPWRTLYWAFPYDFVRGIWPDVRSPLVWDPSAIFTYLTGSILFVYAALIPDLALARDASSSGDRIKAIDMAMEEVGDGVFHSGVFFQDVYRTYTDKLPLRIDQRTGRVHTSYHQAVAATGRLSSTDLNLQNIPIRTVEGRRVRQAFVAPPGRRLVAADYSQIELRIMAHLSGDAGLKAAFADNLDIHRATAAEVFGATLEGVTDDQRRSAKAINFGLIYGMSAFGLSRQLGVPQPVARDYIDTYFARYPGVHDYMERTRKLAHDQGYVETLYGRRLYLPSINARAAMQRQAAERTAINAPMQGTAADIIKRAMISVDRWLAGNGLDALMVMQVHDELVFEVDESQVEPLVEGVRERMAAAAELAVPLVVDCGTGANWDEAH